MREYNKFLTLAPLFLVLVIDTMGAGIVFPIMGPLFMSPEESILAIGTSDFMRQLWYGITLSSWSALMFFGAPFLGDLSDRIGRKKVLILCLIADSLGFVLSAYGIQQELISLLIIGRLVSGFFSGSQSIAQAVIADVSTKENKVHNMSMIILAACIGYIVGPIMGGYVADPKLVSWFTFSTPFYLAGLLALINATLLLFTLRETYVPKMNIKPKLIKGLLVFVEAFTDKDLRLLSINLFCLEAAWSVFFVYEPVYLLLTYHYNNIEIAHYMSYMGVIFAVALTLGLRVSNYFLSLERIVKLFMTGMIIALILLCFFTGEISFWFLSIPIGIAGSVAYSVLLTIYSNSVSEDRQGWVMGISGAISAAAFGISAAFTTVLSSVDRTLPFIVAAIIAAMCVLGMRIHVQRQKKFINPLD